MNSYVDPLTLEERLAHVAEADKNFNTEFDWICDNMDNELKHAFGERPNSEFVIDPEGKVIIKRAWSSPQTLREDLAKLVGASETETKVADLGYEIKTRPEQVAKGVVERVSLPGGMVALKSSLESVDGAPGDELFVKLRAEAEPSLMDGENGKLYVGFHVDPIYSVHWNNDAMSVRYKLNLPEGITTEKLEGEFAKVDVKADADPREFVFDLEVGDEIPSEPIEVTIYCMICDDEETFCTPITEVFHVHLERDRELGRRGGMRGGGMRGGRGGGARGQGGGARGGGGRGQGGGARGQGGGGRGQGGRGQGGGNMVERLMGFDQNDDDKLSKDELPEQMQQRFDQMDANEDGFIDKSEMENLGGGRGGRGNGRGGRGRGDRGDR